MPADIDDLPVTIICERPVDQLSTGVRLRVDHLRDALQRTGRTVDVVSAYTADTTSTRAALRDAPADAARLSPRLQRSVVVCALGGVRLLALSRALTGIGHDVGVDECDSVLLRFWSPLRRGRFREAAWEALRVLLHVRLPHRSHLSYISRRDARVDALLNRGRAVEVHPPTADAALRTLPAFGVGGGVRIVVPADFQSPHLQRGLAMLWTATASSLPIGIQLFGPRRPDRSLPEGVVYEGYAPDLASVYAGDTVVFIANIGGGGVPNKLVEAATAGRPVIVHPSVRRRVDLPLTGWTFRSAADVVDVLRSIADGARPHQLPGG